MGKLLYVTFVDFAATRFGGVQKKINAQITVFESAGYPVTLITRYGSGIAIYRGNERTVIESDIGVFSRRVLTTAATAEATKGGYSHCYMRSQFFCGNVKRMLSRLKDMGICNVVEIPTYPYDNELIAQGLRGYPKLFCDRFYRTRCTKYISTFTSFNTDTEIFGIPSLGLCNGVFVDSLPVTESKYDPNRIDMISVSSMLPWHGVDRAIIGISQYYENGGSRDIHLHICGEGSDRENYEALVKKHGLDDHVTFYGSVYGEKLDEVFRHCTIGLCGLGFHRIDRNNGSPLKTVEYIARGLAVVSEINLDFMPKGNEFLFSISPDEEPLDIAALAEWHDKLMQPGAEQIHSAIRQYAREHCDMSVTLSPVIEFFNAH